MSAARSREDLARAKSPAQPSAVPPVPLQAEHCPDPALIAAAGRAWDQALALGEKHGFRNAQVSVIAPTGTIGLVMDCDTTGIEPDFALVKFKKLAGGGYFKIINRAVPEALDVLGYSKEALLKMAPSFIMNLAHPDELSQHEEHFRRLAGIRRGELVEREFRLHSRHGKWLWLRTHEATLKSDDVGRARQMVGIAEDITFQQAALEVHSRLYYFDLSEGGPRDSGKAPHYGFPTAFQRLTGIVFLDYCTWVLAPRDRCADLAPASDGCAGPG